MRIVGIVKDVKHAGLEWDVLPETFVPYTQVSGPYAKVIAKDIIVALRGHIDVAALRAGIGSLDSQLPINELKTANELIAESADRPRFRTWLITAFAVIAIVLASVGLYGVLSQAVVQRQHEFGIRLALGATRSDVLLQVLRQGMALATIGAVAGVVATLAAGRLINALLYGTRASDPRIAIAVVAVMLVVAAIASLVPARRATGIDPLAALRGD